MRHLPLHPRSPWQSDAMKDIVVKPDAVYGFSLDPDSAWLKNYADAVGWTDPEQVAEARAHRQAYHDSMSELYRMIKDMLHDGRDVETIARAVSKRRNELRLEADANDPEALAWLKSNLETYGDCPIDGWDEQAWCLPVTQVTVYVNGSAEFLFRGENRITVK